jgi:hypothetical protein
LTWHMTTVIEWKFKSETWERYKAQVYNIDTVIQLICDSSVMNLHNLIGVVTGGDKGTWVLGRARILSCNKFH